MQHPVATAASTRRAVNFDLHSIICGSFLFRTATAGDQKKRAGKQKQRDYFFHVTSFVGFHTL